MGGRVVQRAALPAYVGFDGSPHTSPISAQSAGPSLARASLTPILAEPRQRQAAKGVMMFRGVQLPHRVRMVARRSGEPPHSSYLSAAPE